MENNKPEQGNQSAGIRRVRLTRRLTNNKKPEQGEQSLSKEEENSNDASESQVKSTLASGGYHLEGDFDATSGFRIRCGTCGYRQRLRPQQQVVLCPKCNKKHTLPGAKEDDTAELGYSLDKYANFKVCGCGWTDNRVLNFPPVLLSTVLDAFGEWADASSDIAHHHKSIGWKLPLKELPREHPEDSLIILKCFMVPFNTPSRPLNGETVRISPQAFDKWYEEYKNGKRRVRQTCEHSKMPNLSWASTHPVEGEGYLEILPPEPDGLYSVVSVPNTEHGHHMLESGWLLGKRIIEV